MIILTSSKILSKWHGRSTPIFYYTNGQPTKLEPHPSFLRKGMHHLNPIPGWFPTSLLWCTRISINKYIHIQNATGQRTKLEPHPSFLERKRKECTTSVPSQDEFPLHSCDIQEYIHIIIHAQVLTTTILRREEERAREVGGRRIHGHPWTPMDIHGCPWMSIDCHGDVKSTLGELSKIHFFKNHSFV